MRTRINFPLIGYLLTFQLVPLFGEGYWYRWLLRNASINDIIACAPFRTTAFWSWRNQRKLMRLREWLRKHPASAA